MNILTVRQPWAYAIFHLNKDIENRPRRTHVRERIAIHTSATMTAREYADAREFIQARGLGTLPAEPYLFCGVIIGTVEIVDCVERSESPWFTGKYGYVLRNARRFGVPIPAKGRLGFWQSDTLMQLAITRQLIQGVVV